MGTQIDRVYILSPSKTGLVVSAHRLTNITLLDPVDPDSYTVVARGVADLYP